MISLTPVHSSMTNFVYFLCLTDPTTRTPFPYQLNICPPQRHYFLCVVHFAFKTNFLSRENSTRDNKRSLCSARSSSLKKTRHHQLSFIPYPLPQALWEIVWNPKMHFFLQIVSPFISVEVGQRLLKVGFWITLFNSLVWLSHRYSWNENNLGNVSACPPSFLCFYVFEEYMKNILLRIHSFRSLTTELCLCEKNKRSILKTL